LRRLAKLATSYKAKLNDADLSLATLVGSILAGADLTNSSIYGIAAWDIQLDADTQQSRLRLSRPEGPAITVDDLEVAQFIYLLLNRDKLRNVLNAVTERGVLILGRFGGGGLEVLQSVAAKLKDEKYLPILFDFERPANRNYTETIQTLVGLARFVIVDLSGPSIPQELYATVPHFKVPFVPILEEGRKPYSMSIDLLEYPWVVKPPVFFTSKEELIKVLPEKIIIPAEEKHKERQILLSQLFNR
jgi:hypothetical protein